MQCPYKLIIKTGDVAFAGTDSQIKFVLGDNTGGQYVIDSISDHGILGSGYDYFERDKTDVFFFAGPCELRRHCRVELGFISKGEGPDWFVDFFILSASFPSTSDCDHTRWFNVNKWFTGS